MPASLSRAFARPSFRTLFAAHTISRWGDTFNFVAIIILVYRLTGSGLKVGATVIFEILPVLIFGFVAGVVIDRVPRRSVMIGADLGRAALALSLVFLQNHLWGIYGVAFGLSALSTFFSPAAASVVPALVEKDDLVAANSLLWSAAVISQIVLAPVASALVVVAGPTPAFTINAASFLVSALLIFRMRIQHVPPPIPSKRREDVVEGFRVIGRSALLRGLAVVQALAALSAGATSALLIVLATRHLHAGGGRFGFLIVAIGIGAGFGPLVLQRVVREMRRPSLLFGPYMLRGIVDVSLATFSSYSGALVSLSVYGIATSTGTVTFNSVLQTVVPEHARGRVFAFFDVVWQAARLASIALGAVLADAYGIRVVFYLAGGLLLSAGLFGFLTVHADKMSGGGTS
ncbi:MAG: MFS transporter [Actinomycetota bacterium]